MPWPGALSDGTTTDTTTNTAAAAQQLYTSLTRPTPYPDGETNTSASNANEVNYDEMGNVIGSTGD